MDKIKYSLSMADTGFTFLGQETFNHSASDLIIFTGGADIYPGLYNQNCHTRTHPAIGRDKKEVALFNMFKNKPKLGICRGHQLLSVLSGASLIQDVNNHGRAHPVQIYDGQRFEVTSCHHQMVYLEDVSIHDYYLIGWSETLSDTYQDGDNKEIAIGKKVLLKDTYFQEPEIIYWPKTNSLCFQSHPKPLGLA